MAPIQIPDGIPTAWSNAIQQNWLSADFSDALMNRGGYRMDAEPDELPPHVGQTKTYTQLGMFDVDLLPAAPTGAVDLGEFSTEQFTGKPIPHGKGFRLDGPTAYVYRGDLGSEGMGRLYEWAARTSARKARGKLFGAYAAGNAAIVRRAQTTAHSVLLVNSVGPFRYKMVNGQPVAVSGSASLSITIVAATTFTALVTGVTPCDPNFPDGPGELTLSTTLSANVAAQSYVYATNQRVTVIRPNAKASSEALVLAGTPDYPVLTNIQDALARLKGLGVGPHKRTGLYHMHADETLMPLLSRDAAWRQAFQGAGIDPIVGARRYVVPQLGLMLIECNDAPALGRGKECNVGSAGKYSGAGGTGTAGSSVSMQDVGLDVVNSSGVPVRRALITGDGVMKELYIDEEKYFSELGIRKQGNITSNLGVYQMGPYQFVSGAVDRWRINLQPAMDDRGIACKASVSNVFDFVLRTDAAAASNTSDTSLFKRAVALEYASAT